MAQTRTSPVERRRKRQQPERPQQSDNSAPQFGEPGQRRALSHVGGKVHFSGPDPDLAPILEAALAVDSSEAATRAHVHGFHSYPARLHPTTARSLVEQLSERGQVVLDPFCGSGTVLVEAQLAGRRGIGVDANPLSVYLSRVKCSPASKAARSAISKHADLAMTEADERRRAKAPPHKRYSPYDRKWFDTHVLLELDSIRHALERISDERIRMPLFLVLSSVLTKVSLKAGDSTSRQVQKRIASGYVIRHFGERTRELLGQLEEYASLVGKGPTPVRIFEGDARQLKGIEQESVDLVVTSPPYPGVFDYLEHHELRLRWLGLKADRFSKNEIGARRQMDRLGDAGLQHWTRDLSKVLAATRRVLRPRAKACLVLADSVVAGKPVWADELASQLSAAVGLKVLGVASQKRPYFHKATERAFSRRPRREHVVVVQKP